MATAKNKRRDMDVKKLIMSSYSVHLPDPQCMSDFTVKFHGPKETSYEGGVWNVHVMLPPDYPYKSPSIGFSNRLYHPNVDERSGSVCLDVINQTWSPMFDLVNIFEVFLPQLLRYPNASDPLNSDAASHFLDNEEAYNCKVREYVQKYASDEKQLQSCCDESEAKTETTETNHLPVASNVDGNGQGSPQHNICNSSDVMKEDNENEEVEMEDDFDECSSDVSDMSDL